MVASIRTASAIPIPSSLMKAICDNAKAPRATHVISAAAVMTRPVRSRPVAHRLVVRHSGVVALLDPAEQDHAVVG